jgi:hypothetical protein
MDDSIATLMDKRVKVFTCILIILVCNSAISQIGSTISLDRRVDWSNVGVVGGIPSTSGLDVYNVKEFYEVEDVALERINAKGDGSTDDFIALRSIIGAIGVEAKGANKLIVIYFPEGTYKIGAPLDLPSNVILKGAGPAYTIFKFENFVSYCIRIEGALLTGDNIYDVTGGNQKGSNLLQIQSKTPGGIIDLNPGDYVRLSTKMDMSAICGVTTCVPEEGEDVCCFDQEHDHGQIIEVDSVAGNLLTLTDELSITYDLSELIITKIAPERNVGIQDVKITGDIGHHRVFMNYAINSWVSGVESHNTGYHHVAIYRSSNIEVVGSYFHRAKNYTYGYGVYVGYLSTNCLVENNVFGLLRHAVVLSISPNRNVVGYNYCLASNVNQADLSLHGFYANSNLFEGNVCKSFHADQYWGYNGPSNTVFRNKFEKSKICATPRVNLVGNLIDEIEDNCTNTGSDPLKVANDASSTLPDVSYYLDSKPDFLSDGFSWPLIGPPSSSGSVMSNTNPAEVRYGTGGQFTINSRDENGPGYSIENHGLLISLNSSDNSTATITRNNDVLSIGGPIYLSSNGYWKVGPIATVTIGSEEKILSSYTNTSNEGAIYISDKDGGNIERLLLKNNMVVTAMTAGDFTGNGTQEIVIAYLENGLPRVYRSDNIYELEKTLIYSMPEVYWSIDGLTVGDFDSDDDQELILAFNSTGPSSEIYKSEDAMTIGDRIYQDTHNYWDVAAVTAGDFNNSGYDNLLIAGYNSANGPAVYKNHGAKSNGPWELIYEGINYWSLTAMAAGDLDDDGDDELVTAFNSDSEGPNIYKSEDANSVDEVLIYDKNDLYWNVNSLAIEHNKIELEGGVLVTELDDEDASVSSILPNGLVLHVSQLNDCSLSETVSNAVSFGKQVNQCVGASIAYWNTSNWNFNTVKWFVNGIQNSTGPDFTFTPSQAGEYRVKMEVSINGSDCKRWIIDTLNLSNTSNPIIGESNICPSQSGVEYEIDAPGGYNFNWQFWGSLQNIIPNGNTATINFGQWILDADPVVVTYTDVNGCWTETQLTITVSSVDSCTNSVSTCPDVWQSIVAYVGGDEVEYNSTIYKAKWWTQNNRPDLHSSQWDVWLEIGPCGSSSSRKRSEEEVLSSGQIEESSKSIEIYPNPSSGSFTVSSSEVISKVEVYDAYGKLMLTKDISSAEFTVDLPNPSPGIYLVKTYSISEVNVQQLIVR